MMRDTLVQFLARYLSIAEFGDDCVNGLQVEGTRTIERVALGVSVSQRLFKAAAEWKADALLVHHGLFWTSDPYPFTLGGIQRNRVALLLRHDINLLGYHLPLDAHPEVGNNAQLLKILGIRSRARVDVGFLGELDPAMSLETFVQRVDGRLNTQSLVFPYGSPLVRSVAVISGASSREYMQAIEGGADTFVGGDIRESVVREIEETHLNYIHAGHYATERLGVQALGSKLEQEFDLETNFIEIPNPV